MNTAVSKLLLIVSFASSFLALPATAATANGDGLQLIHAQELQSWMKKDAANVHIYDANNEATRTKEGLIPGATVLTSSSQYDVAQTMPADKTSKLVFYCANTKCMASHSAAKKAASAGYKNVYVMADGIEGWKKAGLPSATYQK